MEKYNPLRILGENGWVWQCYSDDPYHADTEDYECYTISILGEYHTTVRACVAQAPDHLAVNGHYGVLWLEAADYECSGPYSEDDLQDMIYALHKAEDNLLTIGMPFCPDYTFYKDNGNRKKKNEKLRRKYNLEEEERKDNEQRR